MRSTGYLGESYTPVECAYRAPLTVPGGGYLDLYLWPSFMLV